MKIISKYIPERALVHVQQLLGEEVYKIYSKAIYVDINQHIFEANSFSMRSKKDFVNFETNWKDYNDYEYYELSISKSDTPYGVKRGENGSLLTPSSISIVPASTITSIELYEDKDVEEWNSEERELITVKYDSAFLFYQADGNKFLIGVSETIADLTRFIRDEKAINERLEGLSKRLEWK
ncbi:hypothetical protein WG947_10250 [Pontibacter sp. H259]|uniref:hypothetical protein n=1 Tax=Pontibacter sp. H259 TaxID=3133421 RepID=UPI0030C14D36